jgi:hypothetical protein
MSVRPLPSLSVVVQWEQCALTQNRATGAAKVKFTTRTMGDYADAMSVNVQASA